MPLRSGLGLPSILSIYTLRSRAKMGRRDYSVRKSEKGKYPAQSLRGLWQFPDVYVTSAAFGFPDISGKPDHTLLILDLSSLFLVEPSYCFHNVGLQTKTVREGTNRTHMKVSSTLPGSIVLCMGYRLTPMRIMRGAASVRKTPRPPAVRIGAYHPTRKLRGETDILEVLLHPLPPPESTIVTDTNNHSTINTQAYLEECVGGKAETSEGFAKLVIPVKTGKDEEDDIESDDDGDGWALRVSSESTCTSVATAPASGSPVIWSLSPPPNAQV
ncbi:hypothetical protein FQN50_002379 [Emmonsiellopsis sp. PD_5]|nr:hypothetical protein FQN50_002379 [Emmonsiellopsis sp. PD_5]